MGHRRKLKGRRQACKGILGVGFGLAGCQSAGVGALPSKASDGDGDGDAPGRAPIETIDLPPPRTDGDVSIESVLLARHSVREWTDDLLTLDQIGQLLWAAQGITHGERLRTSPSAGALYPLELYALTHVGIHHYLPEGHRAELVSEVDVRGQLAAQEFVHDAPAVFVITGVVSRTAEKYGGRADRFVHLEAGHACHGLLLQAVALGLGGTSVGAFDDAAIQEVVGLPEDHDPFYVVPVGVPV